MSIEATISKTLDCHRISVRCHAEVLLGHAAVLGCPGPGRGRSKGSDWQLISHKEALRSSKVSIRVLHPTASDPTQTEVLGKVARSRAALPALGAFINQALEESDLDSCERHHTTSSCTGADRTATS